MKLYRVISLVVVATRTSDALNFSVQGALNGWYTCPKYTFATDGTSDGHDAECAVLSAPLCYPGICKVPECVNPIIDIFVKRIPAVSDPEIAPNVWLLQGGPGYSSTSLESDMEDIHTRLSGAVNVYTMDQRGTGRSTLLDCVVAHVTVGESIDPSKVPACAQALQRKYGSLSSFSTTSAAKDVATFISDYTNDANTIVFGASYGTILAERLMHLNCPEVTGYVLDSIATSSGASQDKAFYVTMLNTDIGDTGDAFMALSAKTRECSKYFVSKSLHDTLQDLITHFDDDPASTCAALVAKIYGDKNRDSVSHILRAILGMMLMTDVTRKLIPPVIYRLYKCRSKDIKVLTHFFTNFDLNLWSTSDDSVFESGILYNLIQFSENWETPTPSMSEVASRETDLLFTCGDSQYVIQLFCAFSKEKSATCDPLGVGSYRANGIVYEVDEYWNKSAKIPAHASVLLMSGKMDAQSHYKYAEFLLEALDGDKKELITFEYALHGVIDSTPLSQGNEMCGMKLLLSYVTNNGNLALLDKSCVDEMPPFNMTLSLEDQYHMMSTDDVYDGFYNVSLYGSLPA